MDSAGRAVSAQLTFQVDSDATIIVQLAAAESAGKVVREQISARDGWGNSSACTPLEGEYGGRLHHLEVTPGLLTISYEADLLAHDPAEVADAPTHIPAAGGELERLIQLRPSRYCPSDHVVGLAVAEFGHLPTARERVLALTEWIHGRIAYVAGASTVHDSAEDTLMTGAGVCRDFAHLGIVLCRALGVPARFASVYAPGLQPMDFHAVFEAWHDGAWWAYDGTRMAPRSSLVRIATGRDAADTPFATVVSGLATLLDVVVTATSAGPLPSDDHTRTVSVA